MIMTELQNVNCFPRIKSLAQFFYEAWVEIFTLNLNILREKIVKGQSNGRLPRKSTLKVFVLDIAQIGGGVPAEIGVANQNIRVIPKMKGCFWDVFALGT